MKKSMDVFKKIRQGLKNPKTKSLTLLGIYAIFFIFVFVVLNISNSSNVSTPNIVENKEENNSITSYEYNCKINNNNIFSEITGTYNNGEEIFNYNNNKYYIKNNKIYLLDNNLEINEGLPLNMVSYNYENISKLVESSEFIEKTTYKDNSEKTTYNITLDKYLNILNLNQNNIINSSNINVTIVVKKLDYINEVFIDLSSYYGFTYQIQINFSNINNIEKISTLSE